jgi:hypothetical protein
MLSPAEAAIQTYFLATPVVNGRLGSTPASLDLQRMTPSGGLPKFRLKPLNGRLAPVAVVPGHLAATRMQTFAQGGGSRMPALIQKPRG